MAEQPGALRRIDWNEYFPFIRIFKSVPMALQPSKLALALAGVVLMGALGYLLDVLWSWKYNRPVGPEVWAYWQVPDIDRWREAQRSERLVVLQRLYTGDGLLAGKAPADLKVLNEPGALKEAQRRLKAQFREEAASRADQPDWIATRAAVYAEAYEALAAYETRGIFDSFLEYEQEVIGQFLAASRALLTLDFGAVTAGTEDVLQGRQMLGEMRRPGDFGGIGMIGSVLLAFRGVQWLLHEHAVFAILFLLGALAIWSLIGGAICRMSAMNAARDEQISARSALTFAGRKFLGFLSAPLLPLLMVVIIGVLLALGGLVFTAIPYLGDILGPILLVLALLGGFVMALIVVGAIAGGSLLWPTIGVEGSDGFDAVSRSYSYFFSQPWRTAFYGIVAAIYGGLTYLIFRYFVYIVLRLTRFFVSLGVWFTERPGTGDPNATKLEAMWPMPTPDNLMGDWSSMLGLIRWERAGAGIIHVWLLLVVLLLCAYLVSYFFSASTIIYLLLRRRVDAIDMEDVYVDEEDEVVAPALGTATSSGPAAAAPTPSPAASAEPSGTDSKPTEGSA
ncbi:MAG TPA: hypothetical protein PL151_03590 [Phycisphaerae bacterium]|nr:hypothetical protein [Phycisphaerae bacterium]HOJ75605.1 hypothetical protein [Phycisphaerae bacterium]HOM50259.1 hypothetical protein [Phycisphaerae bacterium]HON66478.1 hypothetical protein [Phycisphaerae bacterium]HOQ85979.1 hypothetical protein [Phycisphaerae bacterium]